MPQPLRRFETVVFSQAVFTADTDLGAAYGAVIAAWAKVEAMLATATVRVLQDHSQLAAAMYMTLRSDAPRAAVFEEAAAYLPQPWAGHLVSLMGDIRKASKARNKCAHGLWGYSQDHLGAAIYAPSNILADYRYSQFETLVWSVFALSYDPEVIVEGLEIWTKQDFQNVLSGIEKLMDRLGMFVSTK